MKNTVCILHLLFVVLLLVSPELSFADVQIGDIMFKDNGKIVFSDNSEQSSATVQGIQGPQGIQGLQGVAGPVGPQGPAGSPLSVTCALGEVYVQTASGIQCGRIKPFFSGVGTCVGSNCALSCAELYDDCDNNYVNGCESSLLQNQNCGACGNVCQSGYYCANKICTLISPPPLEVTAKIGAATLLNNAIFHVPSFPAFVHFYPNMPAFIYYTIDGTEPTTASSIVPVFESQLTVQANTVLKFFGMDSATQTISSNTQTIIIQSP